MPSITVPKILEEEIERITAQEGLPTIVFYAADGSEALVIIEDGQSKQTIISVGPTGNSCAAIVDWESRP